MKKLRAAGGVIAVALVFGAGVGAGYIIWGYQGTPENPLVETWRVSPRTAGGTAEDLSAYERRIEELETALAQRDAELLAAVQADFYAPPATSVYEAEVPEGQPDALTWEWTERGGGSGLADFAERDVEMNWNPWRFAVDVELTRERDGRLGATVSTNEPGLELEETRFYADDPWEKKWYEKFEVGVGVGYGDGLVGEVHGGWDGWNVSAQRDRLGETYLVRKTWGLFKRSCD
ncbi:MAG: hypothetical protein PVH29_12300 [Candidatus Zixiibacteriota bacterium]|jgi:hypothetical protein